MKRLAIAALLFSSTASATGIPVVDALSNAQNLAHYATVVQNWIQQYDRLTEQYEQLQATHESLTGIRDISDVFDNPELRRLMPDDMREAYKAFRRSGYEGLVRKGVEILAENKVHDVCEKYDSEELRVNCESGRANTAQAHGDAEDAMSIIIARTAQIEQLQSQINTTEDTKAIADIQARIAIEQTTIQNESSRLYVAKILDDTQQRLDADRQRQFNQRTLANTRGFSADLEIPTFGD